MGVIDVPKELQGETHLYYKNGSEQYTFSHGLSSIAIESLRLCVALMTWQGKEHTEAKMRQEMSAPDGLIYRMATTRNIDDIRNITREIWDQYEWGNIKRNLERSKNL
jgi:hypothetical protein